MSKKTGSAEFIRLPGSEKSTVANFLKSALNKSGYDVFNARELFRHSVCDILGVDQVDRIRFFVECRSRNRLSKLSRELRPSLFEEFAKGNSEYVGLFRILIKNLPHKEEFKGSLWLWLEEEGAGWALSRNVSEPTLFYLNDEGFLQREFTYFRDSDFDNNCYH